MHLGTWRAAGAASRLTGQLVHRAARASAVGETRLLELDGETLEVMCIERPEIAIRIISRLTARLIDSERRLSAMGVDDLLGPIVRALLKRADTKSEDGVSWRCGVSPSRSTASW